jgi:hypothetical protein
MACWRNAYAADGRDRFRRNDEAGSYGLVYTAWGAALGTIGWFGLLWMSGFIVVIGITVSRTFGPFGSVSES